MTKDIQIQIEELRGQLDGIKQSWDVALRYADGLEDTYWMVKEKILTLEKIARGEPVDLDEDGVDKGVYGG